jgi:D-glycero-alpha-D-manno-heptose-7-phosphate kinase
MPTKDQLAREAIHIEQNMIKENVGCQDQALAAYGGFNYIEFGGEGHLSQRRVTLPRETVAALQEHVMLCFTGFSRTASEIAQHQIANIPKKTKELYAMYGFVKEALKLLNEARLVDFGKLLHESWLLKRTLSEKISTSHVDDLYDKAIKAGALGGKLLGAGGGGFILIYAEPDKQAAVRTALGGLLEIPFRFENLGSQIIFYQPNSGVVA